MRSEFISAAKSQIDRGIYVWGARGQDVSAMSEAERVEWITRREESMNTSASKIAENIKRDLALYRKRVKAGVSPILSFDCSGLVYWCQVQAKISTKRLNAQGIYKDLCKPITAAEMQYADLCFHYSADDGKIVHVGIYAGNDTVIECKGRDDGVVETEYQKRVKSGYWNRFGRLKKLLPEYDPAPKPEPPQPTTHQYVCVKGKIIKNGKPEKSVNVRSGNGTKYPVLGTAHSTDLLPMLGQADTEPFWYNVIFTHKKDGKEITENGYITCNERYTEVVYRA